MTGMISSPRIICPTPAIPPQAPGCSAIPKSRRDSGTVSVGFGESDECLYFGRTHLGRMAFVVKEDKTGSPVHVSLFGAVGIVPGAYRVAHLIEELLSLWRDRRWFYMHIAPCVWVCYTVSTCNCFFTSCRLPS
jgi:hypothetical protein